MVNAEERAEIQGLFDKHFEWLIVPHEGDAFPVTSHELELTENKNHVLFGFLDGKGFHTWKINEAVRAEDEVHLDLAGAFGKDRTRLKLVPRISAASLAAEIETARLKRANTIADLIKDGLGASRVRRVELAKENGRVAHIFFEDSSKKLNAAIADVTGTITAESMLASAIIWQEKLSLRKKDRVGFVWVIATKKSARSLRKLQALLNASRRESLKVAETSFYNSVEKLSPLSFPRMSDVWRERSRKLVIPGDSQPSETAGRIIDLSPDEIDIIYSKQGETLRFMGLPFARVRTLLGKERSWFGTDSGRQPIGESDWDQIETLVRELHQYRRHEPANRRHQFYRQAPEAWLESILRRNVALLDPNIILSPIYNQFRASNDRIDLLALRKDGRLVIIELKTSPDREMVFQAADYWRKIELQRRQGRLQEARLFGDWKILDKPALVYLAAPAWSFHTDFEYFARMLHRDIELWRFELHKDWRRKVKVVARRNYSDRFSVPTNL